MKDGGLAPGDLEWAVTTPSIQGGRAAAAQLLDRPDPPTGFICHLDDISQVAAVRFVQQRLHVGVHHRHVKHAPPADQPQAPPRNRWNNLSQETTDGQRSLISLSAFVPKVAAYDR